MSPKNTTKKAFSIIELVIVITILILLAILGTVAINKSNEDANNSKVLADINTIKTSLTAYKTENLETLLPAGNRNFFSSSGIYVHVDKDDENFNNAYGVHGFFTDELLANKYLNATPIDPRTNQFYAYGVKLSNGQFDIAGVVKDINNDNYLARTVYDYDGAGGINSLIREYNGAKFVKDRSYNLPYNPENKVLVITDELGNVYHKGDILKVSGGEISKNGKKIGSTTRSDQGLEIYFSDGSKSIISSNSEIKIEELDFPKENILVSNIKLALNAGAIWTQVGQLDDESNFIISTVDVEAAVRGTVFGMEKVDNETRVEVKLGEVDVMKGYINVSNGFDTKECRFYHCQYCYPHFDISANADKCETLNKEFEENDEKRGYGYRSSCENAKEYNLCVRGEASEGELICETGYKGFFIGDECDDFLKNYDSNQDPSFTTLRKNECYSSEKRGTGTDKGYCLNFQYPEEEWAYDEEILVTPENMVGINETCPIGFLKGPEGKCNYIDLDYIDKNYSVSGLNISSGSTIEIGLKDELIYTITYSKNNYILFSLNNNKQAILNKYTVPNDGDYYIVNGLSANSSMDKDTPLTFTLTGNTIDTISKGEHYDDIEYIKIIN